MRVVPGLSPAQAAPLPLTSDEASRAQRVAERLYADLSKLLEPLPPRHRGASALSRHLEVVRNTCQRVLGALQDGEPSLETLAKLPGVKGLDQFIDALERNGHDKSDADLARAAVREFKNLLSSCGGSHAKFAARLAASGQVYDDSPEASVQVRADLFAAAAGVMGRTVGVLTNVNLFWRGPGPDSARDEQVLHRVLASGLIENTVTPAGMPSMLTSGDTLDWCDPSKTGQAFLDRSPVRGATPQALLAPFCSSPFPTVTTRGTQSNQIQVIDPAEMDGPTTFDLVTAKRSYHPILDEASGKQTLDEVWVLNNTPTRHMIFDVYLHREMEREYRPAIDALLWNPGLTVPGENRWAARFPSQPRLELLGPGLGRAASAAYPRQRELTAFLLDQLSMREDDFVGFRCELAYPIWRAGYCMSFEHTAPTG